MDREAQNTAIHGVAKSRTQLSDRTELNENLRNGDLIEIKKMFTEGLLGLKLRKHLNCIPPDYKMGEVYQGKNCKVTVVT